MRPTRPRMSSSKTVGTALAVAPLLVAGLMVAPGVASASSAAPAAPAAPLSAAQARALSANVTQRVIVVLKDQIRQAPASKAMVSTRVRIESQERTGILSDLKATNARGVKTYTSINAVAATVSSGEAARLKANPAVAEVIPDQIIRLASPLDSSSKAATSLTRTPVAGTCATNPSHPALAPQALQAVAADSGQPGAQTARSLGFDGTGVKVAFIADGLDIKNQDFIRADGSHVFVDYKDFSGEGTSVATGGGEAFLDASSIAAQGRHTYNISNYSALPLSQPCYIRVEGVAPGASLVGLDIFGAEDAGFNSSFLQAIDYAVSVDHVNVLNESLGNNFYPDDMASLDAIKQANDDAVAAGTTVTVSSGDAGVTNTIGTPASDPNVIAAGASTTYELPSQIGYGGFQFPGVTGFLNNNISALSSSGFEQNGSTISVLAPGELNWALCSTDTAMYFECLSLAGNPTPIQESGGTSESAPLTAGVAALVIQAYAKTHGGADPSPALVKQIITSTASDVSAPADLQGSGLENAYRAVLAAESINATPAPAASGTLLEGTSQFNAVARGGTPVSVTEHLTNLGSTSESISLSSRTLGAYSQIATRNVTLSDTTSPHSVDYQGYTDNYAVVHFTVPAGVDRLNGSIAYQGASTALSSRVRMNLVDPQGRLADYSLPQGVGNFGDAQVANPVAGHWTAYIWSRDTAAGGTTGPVIFGASVAKYRSFGTVSPSHLTLAGRATGSVTLTVTAPASPGDAAGSLIIASAGQSTLAVPVTVRTLVGNLPATVSGVLTGGNGRASFTGVTEYYQVDVAGGAHALNASLKLADNPGNQSYVWLIDPSGQAQAFQSNGIVTQDSSGNLSYTNSLGANAHVINPAAGRWTVIVVFAPTVSGTALREPFTLSVNETPATVQTSGVPAGRTLSINHPAVAMIHVTNTTNAPEAYFVDGRTNANVAYPLPSVSNATATVPLSAFGNIPFYLVPSQTSQIVGAATTAGTEPIQFDLGAPTGDPDVVSGQGSAVSASVTGNPVTAGEWDIAPDTVGPFGGTGASSETVDTTLTAVTQAFDPAVTSDTGDLWQAAIGGPLTVSPVVVQPGHSADIPVTIAPSGTPGTHVSGWLYLDDDSLFSLYGGLAPNGNTVAAIPYSYTIG